MIALVVFLVVICAPVGVVSYLTGRKRDDVKAAVEIAEYDVYFAAMRADR